jgi:hypothetical protein
MSDLIDYKFEVDMSPLQDFESGMTLNVDIKAGNEADPILQNHPEYFKTNPITFGLEINVKNQETAGLILQTLESLKGMLFAIPQLETFMNMGLQIETRQTENSVCIDVSIGGALAEQVAVGLVLLGGYKTDGNARVELTTGFKAVDGLSMSFDQILQKLCQFRVNLDSKFKSSKEAFNTLTGSLAGALHQIPGLPQKAQKMTSLLNALTILREVNYQYKYDSQEFLNGAIELIKLIKPQDNVIQEISGKVAEGQMMAGMGIEQGKMMGGMFLAPFAEALKSVNFDKLSVFGYLSGINMLYKFELNLPGLDAWLNENFLSSL